MRKYLFIVSLFVTVNCWAQCFKQISAGGTNSIGLKTNGTLWAWGFNFYGQLGDGTNVSKNAPVQIGTSNNWASISSGYQHTAALKTDGTLWTWGRNVYGQLGNGTNTNKNTPTQIGTSTDWASITCGYYSTIALKTNGTMWAWGAIITSSNTPVQVGTASDWVKISSYGSHVIALKTNGTLWAWGNNIYGQLGDGTNTNSSSPIQIGTDNNWVNISGGESHTLAIKTNGTLWAWGRNDLSQLGDGTTTHRNTPTQIGTATNWVSLSAGFYHNIAIKTDGTLWAWGNNGGGELGDGTNTNRNTPTQIGTANNWAKTCVGNAHSLALKADGSLWAWGSNSTDGQLGDGTYNDSNVPIAIACPGVVLNTLDNLGLGSTDPKAEAAFSLRQLSTTYTGPLVRVTIGVNTYDVWPDATGSFSMNSVISVANPSTTPGTKNGTTALSTVATGNTATIAIWYNQSGSSNNYNISNATVAQQPRIINAGTIQTQNGKPSAFFNTSNNQSLSSAAYTFTNFGSGASLLSVCSRGNTNTSGAGLFTLSAHPNYLDIYSGSPTSIRFESGTSGTNIQSTTQTINANTLLQQSVVSNEHRINGAGLLTGSSTGVMASSFVSQFVIGSFAGYWDGYLSELICFPANLTTTARQLGESNQIAYYKTTTTAAPLTPPGNALNFDGTNDFIQTTTYGSTLNNNYTVEQWIRPVNNGTLCFASTREPAEFTFDAKLDAGNKIYVDIGNGANWGTNNSGLLSFDCIYSLNRWMHIAIAINTTTCTVYVNGVSIGTKTHGITNPVLFNSSSYFKIGSVQSVQFFNGNIDEVRVWNTTRTATDVQNNFRDTIAKNSAGLVAYYKFDNGVAAGTNTGLTSLTNEVGNSLTGTLNGFALTGSNSNWVESYALVTPTATAATSITNIGFTANWTAPTLGTIDNGYRLEVSTDSTFITGAIAGSPFSISSGTTTKVLTALTGGTKYYYRIAADKTSVTGQGGYSNVMNVKTTASTTVAPPGTCLSFDGTNDYVQTTAYGTYLPYNYTVEAWVRPMNNSTMCFFSTREPQDLTFDAKLDAGTKILVDIGNISDWGNNNSGILSFDYKYTLGKWMHIAIAVNGTTCYVYVNGNLIGSKNHGVFKPALFAATSLIKMGNVTGIQNFKGSIDEVRVWNTTRSATEIQNNFNDTIAINSAGLLAYYRFENGIAGGTNTGIITLNNEVNNNVTGTLNNFALAGDSSNWIESYAMAIPTATAATAVTATGFTANWTAPTRGTVDNGYRLQVATDSTFATGAISGSPFTISSGTSGAITGLTAATKYFYRVSADKISVAGQGGYSSIISLITTGPAVPTITSFSPTSTCSIKDSIVITGSGFTAVNAVNIGGVAVTSFVVNSATQITAKFTGVATGTISITNAIGTGTSTNVFTVNPPPSVTITPSGSTTFCNGDSVTLTANIAATTINKSISLAGSNYANCGNGASVRITTGTIEAWIKTSNAGSSFRGIITKEYAYGLFLLDNKVYVHDWTASAAYTGTVNLNDNNWHHVAFSFQSGVTNGSQVYVDGIAVGSAFTYTSSNQNGPIVIGNNGTTNPQHFTGEIDEVRIWSTVRTATEINNNKGNVVDPNASGLVAYYRLDEGTGNTISDLTTNANNGTFAATPTWLTSTAPIAAYSNATFLWGSSGASNGATTKSIVVKSSGNYNVDATANGCRGSATSIIVKINPSVMGRLYHPTKGNINSVKTYSTTVGAKDSVIANGTYSFKCLSYNGTFTIRPTKNNDSSKANGVTILDVIQIQNHVLNKAKLNSPYKLIAADVNNSKTITPLDVIGVKKLILNLDTTFTGKRLWAFVDSAYQFPDTTNPFPYKDSISFTNLTSNKTNQTFIGVKLGDVNYDWKPAVARGVKSLELIVNDKWLMVNGKPEINLQFTTNNFQLITGFQYTLHFDNAKYELVEIRNNKLDIEYNATQANATGNISFLWADKNTEPITLANGSELFTLVLKAKAATSEQEIRNLKLEITNSMAEVEAWDNDYTKHNITLTHKQSNTAQPTTNYFAVYPNPSKGVVTIASKGVKQIEVIDVMGRVVKKSLVSESLSQLNVQLNNGVYVVKALMQDGSVRNEKLLVE